VPIDVGPIATTQIPEETIGRVDFQSEMMAGEIVIPIEAQLGRRCTSDDECLVAFKLVGRAHVWTSHNFDNDPNRTQTRG